MDFAKQKIISEVKKLTKETLESSSIHAIPNITRNKFYLIKFVWLICFLISTGFCGWFIQNSIIDYLSNDVVSKTDIRYVNNLIMPIISFCNINPFSTKYSNAFFSNILGQYPNMSHYAEYARIIANNGEKSLFKFSPNLNKIDLNDIIIYCSMGIGGTCDLENDFEYYYDVNYGNCFRFNSGRNKIGQSVPFKYASKSGSINGFELEIYVGKSSENDNIFSKESGFILFLNNETLDSTSSEGIFIAPGTSTRIIISKYSMSKKPVPYSECTAELISIDSYGSDLYKKTFSLNRTYHYTDCINVCYQKNIANFCGCQSGFFSLVYDSSLPKCGLNDNESGLCERSYSIEFYKTTFNTDECDCPVECKKTEYTYTSSTADFPTRNYLNYLVQNDLIKKKFSNQSSISYQDLKESLARVIVFYDELKETTITQDIKVRLPDLVANIGGLLGLFLGLSFLSLVEILEILMQILLILINERKLSKSLFKINYIGKIKPIKPRDDKI